MVHAQPSAVVSPQYHLYLFGPFRLDRDGERIVLYSRKVESLFAYLALFPQAHMREKLAALLWGDSSDEQARGSLRRALSDLRQHLGPDAVLSDRETVQRNPQFALWVDAIEFGNSARRSDASDIESLHSAVTLYRGDLLADSYDEWIFPARDEYRGLYLDALVHLLEAARTASEYEQAIALAQTILATDRAREQAHQHLMFCYAALGNRSTALEQYETCRTALREELGVEPSQETRALYASILKKEETGSRAARLTNLPKPLTSFVGREKQVAELTELVTSQTLVTLTGAGGSGKTRLAIQLGHQVYRQFADGVWFVDLVPLADPTLVPQQVMKTLGVQEQPQRDVSETLIEFLEKKPLLLILDNCEHLVNACAALAETLVTQCEMLHVLATSREALGISGETVWQIPTLAVPTTEGVAQWLMEYEGIRLFVDRARLVNPRFELTEQNASPVVRICRRLDGIPLALELAAARIKVLTPEQIAARLDDRFNLLTTGSRTALPRQQTLRALIDWSYDLLSRQERVVLQRLSVFAGGWTLEAAEHVAGDGHENIPTNEVLDLLAHLADKSLANVEAKPNAIRYSMLETIREYAQGKLEKSGEAAQVRGRHFEFFSKLAEEAEPKLDGREQLYWLNQLEREHDNLRAALTWSENEQESSESGLRLAAPLWRFWEMRGHLTEGRHWLEELLQADRRASDSIRAKTLAGAGTLAWQQGDYARATDLHQKALDLYRQLGDKEGIAFSINNLGTQALHQRAFEQARTFFQEGLALAREQGNQRLTGYLLHNLGEVARYAGDFAEATRLYRESLALFEAVGDKWASAVTLNWLGVVAQRQDQYEQATEFLKQSLTLGRELESNERIAEALEGLAGVAVAQRNSSRAARLFGAAQMLREIMNAPLPPTERDEYDRNIAANLSQVESKALAEGQAMTLEQAVEYALNDAKT